MPSTYSTNLKIELIPTGAQSGVWGVTTNSNLGTAMEQAIVGTATCITGDFTANVATYLLTDNNAAQTARAFCLNITATLTAAGTINVPAIQKPYLVFNNSVGGFAVTVKVSGQTGVSIPNGSKAWLYNNGTDVGVAFNYAPSLILGTPLLPASGGTGVNSLGTGVATWLQTPSSTNLQAAVTDETGSGTLVFSNSPALVTPNLGTPSFATLTSATGLPLTTGVTGTLLTDKGGTGQSAYTAGDLTYYASGTAFTKLPIGASTFVLTSTGTAPQWVSPSTIPVGTATNLAGGSNGTVPYQSASGTTQMLAAGVSGYVFQANGVGAPSWVAQSTLAAGSATTATNLAGGSANRFPYQSGAGATVFLAAPTVTGTAIVYDGANVGWALGPAAVSTTNIAGGTAGVVPYQSGAGATAFTAVGSAGYSLTSQGVGTPTWSQVSLTAGVTGTLPIASGGTNLTTLTANNVILGNGTSSPLFVAPSTSGNVLTSTGTTWASSVPAAGGVSYTSVKTTNYTAVNNDGVLTNTTGGAFTVTLPTSPLVGNIIVVVDSFSQWGTNNLTIDPTALIKIANNTAGDTLTCDITGITVTLVYTGATYGWNVSAQIGGNSGTVVTLNGVQTLTNKTINGSNNTITNVSLTTGVTGTLPNTNGGTGQSSAFTQYGVTYASTTGILATTAAGTATQVLTSNGTSAPTFQTLPASGVTAIELFYYANA